MLTLNVTVYLLGNSMNYFLFAMEPTQKKKKQMCYLKQCFGTLNIHVHEKADF